MRRRSTEPPGLTRFPLSQHTHPLVRRGFAAPPIQMLRIDVEEDAFAELLDSREPLDIPSKIGTINCELNFIQLAFGGRWRRLEARETIQTSYFPKPMNLDDPRQEISPRLIQTQFVQRQCFREKMRRRAVVSDETSAGRQDVKLCDPGISGSRRIPSLFVECAQNFFV
ncbi:hypothetical protein AGR9A_Cc70236 [Agrobacterium salinitolerans str. Hayward 0363]|nr:hypothetical protein AGR9A_Cc70236 [Agrobacterium salinitolerans str. Hayward 0363]